MGRRPTWTDEELVMAVAGSTSFREVVLRLREEAGGASHRAVRKRVEELGLDTSHFGRTERGDDGRLVWASEPPEPPDDQEGIADRRSWTDEDLERAVAAASSLNGVFGELGLVVGGTQWIVVRRTIEEQGLDTSHWNRPLGRNARRWTADDLRAAVPLSRSISEVMRRLGLQPGGRTHGVITERIETLGLDTSHMTGQAWLHQRIENLRLLCPNCHSQTETYCGRNKGRYASEAAAPYIAA